jgi:hypothetical protein
MTEALADAGSSSHAGGLVLFGRECCAGSEEPFLMRWILHYARRVWCTVHFDQWKGNFG